MHCGFYKPEKVLKPEKSICGPWQSPCNFLKHLKSKFAKLGFRQPQDPECVKGIYMICIAEFPVIWKSKLQTENALSAKEVEYVAISMAMPDLIPLKYGVQNVASSIVQ